MTGILPNSTDAAKDCLPSPQAKAHNFSKLLLMKLYINNISIFILAYIIYKYINILFSYPSLFMNQYNGTKSSCKKPSLLISPSSHELCLTCVMLHSSNHSIMDRLSCHCKGVHLCSGLQHLYLITLTFTPQKISI